MHRITKILLAAALVAFGVLQWFAPHLTVHAMRQAAERGDAEALASHVDFPALRESVRTQLAARVSDRLGGDSAWSRLGGDIATTLATPAIDAMVSPEALAMLFAGHDLHDRYTGPADTTPPTADATDSHGGIDTGQWRLSMGYDDLSTFSVKVANDGMGPAPSRLVFKRHHLLWWKLSALELPPVGGEAGAR